MSFSALLRIFACTALFQPLYLMAETSAAPASPVSTTRATAYLGGGCFWCLEALYQTVDGVSEVVSGFAGGGTQAASYKEVCSGTTGHAEVIRITYDPAKLSNAQILELFWEAHDPTTLNRQGADVGTQYRSIILTTTAEEAALATASKAAAQRAFTDPIVTQIVPLDAFHPAEAYHQDYYRRNSEASYCRYVIRPKLEKFVRHAVPTSQQAQQQQ